MVPPLARYQRAACPRCASTVGRPLDTSGDSLTRATVCALAALIMFLAALKLPVLDLHSLGRLYRATLFTGPTNLETLGTSLVAGLVVLTIIVLPAVELVLLLTVMLGVRLLHPPSWLADLFAVALRLRAYAMTEVFLLGVIVAITRLQVIATITLGPALLALGAMMLCLIATLAELDPETIWSRLRRPQPVPSPLATAPVTAAPLTATRRKNLIGCDCCRLVLTAQENTACPRCGARLAHRKSHSLTRSTAFLLAGVIMYLPANLYPVMTVIRFGQGAPSTIMGGVIELLQMQMWPLALLVFTASIAVPVAKITGLFTMLIATSRKSSRALIFRTRLYRIIDGVGRWSMIDVFMLTVLVALVRMGFIASVIPGTGAGAFAAVVITTMLASECFDPRLMWDATEAKTHK